MFPRCEKVDLRGLARGLKAGQQRHRAQNQNQLAGTPYRFSLRDAAVAAWVPAKRAAALDPMKRSSRLLGYPSAQIRAGLLRNTRDAIPNP